MKERVHVFNAGPSCIPVEVLKEAQAELVNFKGLGMSLMELSHRSKDYEAVHNETIALFRELMEIPEDYTVLFLQGGGSHQFMMTAANFLKKKGAYINTDSWTAKAIKEAKFFGEPYEAASSKEDGFRYIPKEYKLQPDTDYAYICVNNTIQGTEWHEIPDFGIPLIGDMSSDILSRPVDVSKFSIIFAGAQKNLGPAGVTVVIIKNEFLAGANTELPAILQYKTFAEQNSLYNTPPTFAIYMMNLTLKWIKKNGGTKGMAERNNAKAKVLYDVIDGSNGFYKGHAVPEDRSKMNVTFTLADPELEKEFLAGAAARDFIGVKGHRSVGGCRASIYNAVTLEDCQALAEYMAAFAADHKK